MRLALAFLALASLPALADSPQQVAARKLLISAYIEGKSFCMEFPRSTYTTHIGGIRIYADCKTRNEFEAILAEKGITLQVAENMTSEQIDKVLNDE